MATEKKSLAFLLLLSLLSVLMTCVGVEIVLRLFRLAPYRRPEHIVPENRLFHQRSAIPGLDYEMAPNRELVKDGILIRTNQYGMRDTEPSEQKSDSPCRIAAIGDSYTFGWRVATDDSFPKVLEKLLRKSAAGKDCRFEVLNFAVSGYSSYDEALMLRYRVVNFDPHVVIVGYVLNDPEIDPVQPLHSYFARFEWWQYSGILRLIAGARYNWEIKHLGDGDYYKYLHAPGHKKWQSVVDAFRDIREVTAPRNIKVAVVILPELTIDFKGKPWTEYPYRGLHQQVSDLALQNGFRVIDLLPAFSQYPSEDVVFPGGDDHPTKLGHEIAAAAIENELLTEKLYYFESSPKQGAVRSH